MQFSETGRGIDFLSVGILDSIAAKMSAFTQVRAIVRGYTDNALDSEQSKAQTQRDAERIKSLLISRGISGERIEAVGMGAVDFIDTNTTADGRARNRRIEIEFVF